MKTPQRKKCNKCGMRKHFSQFYTHPRTADGLQTICKECNGYNGKNGPRGDKQIESANGEVWTETRVVDHLANDYNAGLQAKQLAQRRPKRMRVIPRIITECRNPKAFSHNGEMVIYSYHEVERCPYCGHQNYLVRTGYERTN